MFVVLGVLFLGVVGCGKKNEEQNDEISKIISEGNYTIVDVRTKQEFDEGHVVGAINIPFDQIDERVSLNKNNTILVYCKSGRRSAVAYDTLKNLGYEVINLGAFEDIKLDKE